MKSDHESEPSRMAEIAKAMQPTLEYGKQMAEVVKAMQPARDYRTQMAEAAKAMQPVIDYRNQMAEVTKAMQPALDYRRQMAEAAKAMQPVIDYRNQMAEVAKAMQPALDYRKLMAELTQALRPALDYRRQMVEAAKAMQPVIDYRNQMAEVTKAMQPALDYRRQMAEAAKAMQPVIDYRNQMAEVAKAMQPALDYRKLMAGMTQALRPLIDRPRVMAQFDDYATGLLASLKSGVTALPKIAAGVVGLASPSIASQSVAASESGSLVRPPALHDSLEAVTGALAELLSLSKDNSAKLQQVLESVKKQPTLLQIIVLGVFINLLTDGLLYCWHALFQPGTRVQTEPPRKTPKKSISNRQSTLPTQRKAARARPTTRSDPIRPTRRSVVLRAGRSRHSQRIAYIQKDTPVIIQRKCRRWVYVISLDQFFVPQFGWLRSSDISLRHSKHPRGRSTQILPRPSSQDRDLPFDLGNG